MATAWRIMVWVNIAKYVAISCHQHLRTQHQKRQLERCFTWRTRVVVATPARVSRQILDRALSKRPVWHRGVGTSRTVVAKTGEKLSIIQASRCAASVLAHDISGCHDIETRKDNSCLIFGDRPVQHVVSTNRLGPKRCRWNRIVQSFDVGKILEVNNPCPSDISHVSKLFILFALVR